MIWRCRTLITEYKSRMRNKLRWGGVEVIAGQRPGIKKEKRMVDRQGTMLRGPWKEERQNKQGDTVLSSVNASQ